MTDKTPEPMSDERLEELSTATFVNPRSFPTIVAECTAEIRRLRAENKRQQDDLDHYAHII
jgi:hypothetical protein